MIYRFIAFVRALYMSYKFEDFQSYEGQMEMFRKSSTVCVLLIFIICSFVRTHVCLYRNTFYWNNKCTFERSNEKIYRFTANVNCTVVELNRNVSSQNNYYYIYPTYKTVYTVCVLFDQFFWNQISDVGTFNLKHFRNYILIEYKYTFTVFYRRDF